MPEAPPGASALGAFPLGHLWFLYYLLMLYVVVVLGRHAVVALDRSGRIREAADRIVRASVSGGSAVVLLALPLGLALYFRSDWLVWFGIPTPDQTLIPQWIPLVGYGTAVAFGWLVQRQPELLASWGRQWPGYLAAAMVATGVCLWIGGPRPSFTPVASGLERLASALGYGLALWSWTFAFVGLALRFMSGESRARRYVADSSYWLYLVHLPVVAALQVAVGHQPWHWSVKFPLILAGAFALLFLSYHHLVRYTFIGAVLNGRKLRPARPRPDPKPTGAGRVSLGEPRTADAEPSDSLATLEGVHKRYGKTIALAGLDLEVRRGELLALLGPNGAGKSTAVSLWLGLLEPDQGRVALLGRSPSDVEKNIHSEYSMTELMSQAYSKSSGMFFTPPWMKILIRDIDDPFSTNTTGAINIIDLANIDSCSFIATQDLGKISTDNSFEVLGRVYNSDIRGCNLLF
jgi:peptidoglycan/LPS O-acetylase OafA/YrhL